MLGAARSGPLLTGDRAEALPVAALAAPPSVLEQAEAAALLAAAHGTTRVLCAAGLLGLCAAEVVALRGRDVDTALQRLNVPGAWARSLPLPPWLALSLEQQALGDGPLLHDAAGEAITDADLQAWIVGASIDAGLPQGASLNLEVLRNTCIDWLVAQGLRFADLPALVGRIDAGRVAAFAGRAADAPRRAASEIDLLMPALRMPPPG
jgi:integrase